MRNQRFQRSLLTLEKSAAIFTASPKTLRAISSFTRDDGTPLNDTLVNIKDWCKNTFDVSNRGRTYYFANNNARHFAFNADERFLPVYQMANAEVRMWNL